MLWGEEGLCVCVHWFVCVLWGDPKQICLLVINSPDWHSRCQSYGKAAACECVCINSTFLCVPAVCVHMNACTGSGPAIKGISMSQGWESGYWESSPVALRLPLIRPVCRPAALLTHSCLSANLYRVDFTDRVIGALETEGRGGEGVLWQKDKCGRWEGDGGESQEWCKKDFLVNDITDVVGRMTPAVSLQIHEPTPQTLKKCTQ